LLAAVEAAVGQAITVLVEAAQVGCSIKVEDQF